MAAVPPVVRYLIVCEDCRIDLVNPRKISAINLVAYVDPPRAMGYPFSLPVIAAICMITEGRGAATFHLEIVKDLDPAIYRSSAQVRTFGSDPLQVSALTFRIRNLVIPQAGVYEFRLFCDDVILAVQPVRAR